MEKLGFRMYGLVNYQLTGIQKGIQFGHAVVKYGQMAKQLGGKILNNYNEWADNHQTFIILDGGSTNKKSSGKGNLNKHLELFKENNILCADFSEPDLGDQLTSFVFLVDERVYDRKKYPDYKKNFFLKFVPKEIDLNYKIWVNKIGKENVFLRENLPKFKLSI